MSLLQEEGSGVGLEPTMRPKLKENVWHLYPDAERANLITTQAAYNVPRHAAQAFLKMRSFCTGYNTIADIAVKSGFSVKDVMDCIQSLQPAGIVYSLDGPVAEFPQEIARDLLLKSSAIWANELRNNYIGNGFVNGTLHRNVLIGWLLEMYHYIKDFPEAIAHAARYAEGALRDLLTKFANEERGHEVFVEGTLVNLGLSPKEIETSHPMLSTRLIGLLMRELFELEPSSVLLLAALVEAQEFDEKQIQAFKTKLEEHYDIKAGAMDPYFEHQRIDVALGHAQMLEDNMQLLRIRDRVCMDQVVNKLHDIKHAFELQGLEIRQYYSSLNGKYIPRQPVTFASL
jgi:Iron-containing redox enzyme